MRKPRATAELRALIAAARCPSRIADRPALTGPDSPSASVASRAWARAGEELLVLLGDHAIEQFGGPAGVARGLGRAPVVEESPGEGEQRLSAFKEDLVLVRPAIDQRPMELDRLRGGGDRVRLPSGQAAIREIPARS